MKHSIILILIVIGFSGNAANKYIATDTIQKVNANILYKVFSDDTYIYLNVSTTDKKTCMSLIRKGLTVYFDSKGKEKKDVYIKYPVRIDPKQMQKNTTSSNKENNLKDFDVNKIIETLPYDAEYGYFDDTEQFHKALNRLGISLGYKYTVSNELLEFNIKIPKDKISSGKNKSLSKLSIGVISNKPENSPNQSKNQISSGVRNRGGKGGMRSGTMGRGGIGRNGIGQSNGQRPIFAAEPVSIDFWFDASIKEN